MRTETAVMDFSKIMKIMIVTSMTAGLILSAVHTSTAADRGGRHHSTTVRETSWKDGRRVTVVQKSHRRDVRVVRQLPRGYKRVKVGHKDYYTHGGRYYEKGPRGFISIAPPYGAWFLSLPIGSARLTIGGRTYFRHYGTYYQAGPRGYAVVAPPTPAFTSSIPAAVIVRTSLLNVRSGPGSGFAIVGRTFGGETLFVSGSAPGWLYVQLPNGYFGWVHSGFVSPIGAG